MILCVNMNAMPITKADHKPRLIRTPSVNSRRVGRMRVSVRMSEMLVLAFSWAVYTFRPVSRRILEARLCKITSGRTSGRAKNRIGRSVE